MKCETRSAWSALIEKIDDMLSGTATRIIISISVFLLCGLIEIFGFNAWYFALPASSRGIFHVGLENIQNDKSENTADMLVIHESSAMRIQSPMYIARLEVYAANPSPAFSISLWNEKHPKPGTPKQYSVNAAVNKFAVIDTFGYAKQVHYEIRVPAGDAASIQSLTIINTLHINPWRILFMLSVGFLVCFFAFFHRRFAGKLPAVFAIIAVSVGLCTALFTPPYSVYDEAEHFVKAYRLASFDFSIRKEVPIPWPQNSDQFFEYRNESAIPFESGLEKSEFIRQFASNDYSNLQYYHTTASNYTPVAYVPAAVGIWLGKSIHLPFIAVFYLGRIFSLLAYAIIGYFTLKSLKIAQPLVFALLLLPSMLYSVCGYSADGLTYMLAIVLVSLFLNMLGSSAGKITLRSVLLFSAAAALSAATKVAYAPLCLLILTIPTAKFAAPRRAKLLKLLSLIIVGIVTLLCLKLTFSVSVNQWGIPNVSARQQLLYIFTHPFYYMDVIFRQFLRQTEDLASRCTIFLAYSGSLDTFWQYFCVVGLFILAVVSAEDEPPLLAGREKVMLFLTVCLCWGAVATALYLGYTPVGSSSVDGLQGRYFAPLLLPSLLLVHNRKIVYKIKPRKFYFAVEVACSFVLILMNHFLLINFNN